MVSLGFVPLSLNNGFRSELKQLETQKSKKKIKALTGITAQDKNQLLHRYFIVSQFLLLRKTLGKNPETPGTTSIFPIFVDTTFKCDLHSSMYQHTKVCTYMKKIFAIASLLTILFFSLSGLTSDKPLEKSITNSRNEQFQILALPALLLFQMFCNFYSIVYVHMELSVLPKYGKIMSQK